MHVRVRFVRQAIGHVAKAHRWWKQYRTSAPRLFRDELAQALRLLRAAPDVGVPYHHSGVRGVRRILLPQSRYHVDYVCDDKASELAILAVWSALRGRAPRLKLL